MPTPRSDPPEPEHLLDPPVQVIVTVDGQQWPGLAERWRGRWVLCSWSRGVGLQHIGWLLRDDVERV